MARCKNSCAAVHWPCWRASRPSVTSNAGAENAYELAVDAADLVYADAEARQYGILIYTGSPDAEGTLGGLVEAGRRFRELLAAALDLGRICSNDPVCSSQEPDRNAHRLLLGSACHCCLLIAETSCEQRNDFLDRSLVVPTLAARGAEFFR